MTLAAGLIALFAWSPWVKPTEAEWLVAYEMWSDDTEALLATGLEISRAACESTFDDEVGNPPTERLQSTAAAARGRCTAPSLGRWQRGEVDVVRALTVVHSEVLPPKQRRDVSELASSSVGVKPDVYCWQRGGWTSLSEHYAIVRGGEESSLRGIVDGARNRIDLDPGICVTLDGYLRRIRPPKLSSQNLELAEALIVLMHQAEHLKRPSASEAELECDAVQHVRPLVRPAWGLDFATEIALHGWQIYYPRLPRQFRSPACRDGGAFDRNPSSSAWP